MSGAMLVVTWTNGEAVSRAFRGAKASTSIKVGLAMLEAEDGHAIELAAGGYGGVPYTFTLAGAVSGCEERHLTFDALEAVAAQQGWICVDSLGDNTTADREWDKATSLPRPVLDDHARATCALYGHARFVRVCPVVK